MSGKSFVHSTSPDAFVQFWSFNKENLSNASASNRAFMEVSEVLVKKDILSIKTTKTKGSVGTFTITLSSAINWKKAITIGSWCFIHISDERLEGVEGPEPNGGLKMIGIVRSIRRQESTSPESGIRVVRYVVSGEDFQSMMSSKVYISPVLTEGDQSKAVNSLAVLGTLFEKTIDKGPKEIVEALIQAIIGNSKFYYTLKGTDGKPKKEVSTFAQFRAGVSVQVPKEVFSKIYGVSGTALSEMITRQIFPTFMGKLSSFIPTFSDQIDLWSAIKAYSNDILNEVYTDLLPINENGKTRLVPCFVMRPIPFSINPPAGTTANTIKFLSASLKEKPIEPQKIGRAAADKERKKRTQILPKTSNHFYISRQIFEDEIISFDNGKSDAERINLFVISSTIAGTADQTVQTLASGGLENMTNTASAVRHGLKPLIYTTIYDTLRDKNDTTFSLMTKVVKDMYQNGHIYENGFLTIVGTPSHIPVGTNIQFSERGWIAHVEAVSYDFSVEPSTGHKKYLTNIAFTRLMKTDGNPIDQFEASLSSGQLGEWDRAVVDIGDSGSILQAKTIQNIPKVETKKGRK